MSTLEDDSDEVSLGTGDGVRPRRAIAAVATLLLSAVAVVIASAVFSESTLERREADSRPPFERRSVTGLDRDGPCFQYPYLKFQADSGVLYSNLANKGPDHGHGEGIVYRVVELGRAAGKYVDRELVITVNASSKTYKPFAPRLNGLQGKYGSINLASGSTVDLKMHFYDVEGGSRVQLRKVAFTFFDLDTGKNGASTESVTVGGFKRYHLTQHSEVKITKERDGRHTFSGSTYGTGEDNPLDPMFLTQKQKNRAVTLTFEDLEELQVTLRAGPGRGPRFFTFVGRPSLMCAVTVQEGFKPPLPDLEALPPTEMAVQVSRGERFVKWVVKKGQEVKAGDAVCVTQNVVNTTGSYKAPMDGTVVALQDKLKRGDDLDLRLDNKTVCVIRKPRLPRLKAAPPSILFASHTGVDGLGKKTTFVKYLKKPGDPVSEGEGIVELRKENGEIVTIKATGCGVVQERQEQIVQGDLILMLTDLNLMTLGKFTALGPVNKHNRKAAVASEGMKLVEFKVHMGDIVKKNAVIAVVKDAETGRHEELVTPEDGIVTSVQKVRPGDRIDRVEDRNLATVGQFPALPCKEGEEGPTLNGLVGVRFVRYDVSPGDVVEYGDSVATVTREQDEAVLHVTASRPGVVRRIQDGLREGMRLDKVMQDRNLATLAKLPPLEITTHEQGSFAPSKGKWKLKEWKVRLGDEVVKNATIATLIAEDGTERAVRSQRAGSIVKLQQRLHKGDVVEDVVVDNDVAVVGDFLEPAMGFREQGVEVPDLDCIFEGWLVKEGDAVEFGDPIAKVTMGAEEEEPTKGRGTSAAGSSHSRRLESRSVKVLSPATGTVAWEMPLERGKRIRDQAVGTTIAKVYLGWPWWLVVLTVMALLCCLCACLICCWINRPRGGRTASFPAPPKTSLTSEMPPEPSGRDVPGPKPVSAPPTPDTQALKLEFSDRGTIRVVHVKFRPLGIKNHFQAPIVVQDFTANSYAKMELGVREGWKLVTIGNQDVSKNRNFEEINSLLHDQMKTFPVWPLTVEFRRRLESAEGILVRFNERPLGLEFANVTPIEVSKVHRDSPADRAGAQVGWYITKIADYDVQEHHNIREVMHILNEGVQYLDDSGRRLS